METRTAGKQLLSEALQKAGTHQTLADALGESRQLVGLWVRNPQGPPKWRHAQLRAYLEQDSQPGQGRAA